MGTVVQNFPSNTREMGLLRGYSLSVQLRTRGKHALAASDRHSTGPGLFSPHLNIFLSWTTPLLRQRKQSHSTVSLTAQQSTNTSQSMTKSTDSRSHRETSEPTPQRNRRNPYSETLPVTGDIFSDMHLEARSRDPQVGPTWA
jgi:hypothetical protein